MRKLIVTENITLDGVIDASEGWFAPAGDEAVISPTSTRRFTSRQAPPTRCCSDGSLLKNFAAIGRCGPTTRRG
jgi:hypothetical protein